MNGCLKCLWLSKGAMTQAPLTAVREARFLFFCKTGGLVSWALNAVDGCSCTLGFTCRGKIFQRKMAAWILSPSLCGLIQVFLALYFFLRYLETSKHSSKHTFPKCPEFLNLNQWVVYKWTYNTGWEISERWLVETSCIYFKYLPYLGESSISRV